MSEKFLGVDYYPEQWPRERWETDARMMAELGLRLVRVGEFAWDLMEPKEGVFEFGWLDDALTVLHQHGLQVLLGTPTPTPPPWLTTQYDVLQRDKQRLPLYPGTRRHVCANNPNYRHLSSRIVTEMVRQYADHPAVIGWQIDNEFSCHRTTWCYCDHCHTAFHGWLRRKYGTLDVLNAAWGTVFWSAIYTAWAQVPLPWQAPAQHSPSLQLDFRRFSSDSWVDYQKMQADILRTHTDRPLTHNFMGAGEEIVDQQDYFELARDLDFVSWDNYPQAAPDEAHVALNQDMMRGFGRERPFWVIEQQPGVVNWDVYNRPVPPGQVRVWSQQGFGHGAEGMVFFRWRMGRFGQEQYHTAVLKQDGSPTRLYDEIHQLQDDLEQTGPWQRRPSKVAILFHYPDWWTIQIDPHQGDFSYLEVVHGLYKQLWTAGIGVDFLNRGEQHDLSRYEAVLIPCPILIDDAEAADWQTYVENGGRLLVTYRAFAKEQGSNWTTRPLPGGLQPLLGVDVDEYLPIPPDMSATAGGHAYHRWAEVLRPTTAEPLLHYDDRYWAGEPAAAVNRVGDGTAVTLGCWFTEQPLPPAVWSALGLDGLGVPFALPAGVEANAIRYADGRDGHQLLNHNQRPVDVTLPFAPQVAGDGQTHGRTIRLPGLGVAFVSAA